MSYWLQGRNSTSKPPVHFLLVILEQGSVNYLNRLTSNHDPPVSPSEELGLKAQATGNSLNILRDLWDVFV
jgi:hypothetical protein